jgi:hypothetical protein
MRVEPETLKRMLHIVAHYSSGGVIITSCATLLRDVMRLDLSPELRVQVQKIIAELDALAASVVLETARAAEQLNGN